MSRENRTYNPCDDCQYSYSKNGQETGMCKICEFTYFKDRKQSEVVEEYRQRVNVKMGKHTHLLGKEYVQRILREVAKEMKDGE